MGPAVGKPALPMLQGVRVLVVEDDALLLMELEEIVADAGAEVVPLCRTVADGIAAAQQDGIEAAVLDVRIGRDTIAPVARQLASRGTPFVFYRTGRLRSRHRGIVGAHPYCQIGQGPKPSWRPRPACYGKRAPETETCFARSCAV